MTRIRLTVHALACLIGLTGWTAQPAEAGASDTPETYRGRSLFVHVPARLPERGSRAMVIVLHGGLGNAERILTGQAEQGLNLDAEADRDGFVVAYLNGTPVTRRLGRDLLGWNAGGGCCGVPATDDVNDVGYLQGAIATLSAEHGIEPHHVFAIGHSNGAMMVMRMMCETDSLAAAISVAGPLNTDDGQCKAARGKRILGIHGENDQNVPIAGGVGPLGLSGTVFKSEERTRRIFKAAGAQFELQILPDTDHVLVHIEESLRRTEGVSLAEKAACYFALDSRSCASAD